MVANVAVGTIAAAVHPARDQTFDPLDFIVEHVLHLIGSSAGLEQSQGTVVVQGLDLQRVISKVSSGRLRKFVICHLIFFKEESV